MLNHPPVHVNMYVHWDWIASPQSRIEGPISLQTKHTKTSIRTDNKSENKNNNNNTHLYNEMILEVFHYYHHCGRRCYCHRRQRIRSTPPTSSLPLPLFRHEKQKKTTHLIVSFVRCHYFGTADIWLIWRICRSGNERSATEHIIYKNKCCAIHCNRLLQHSDGKLNVRMECSMLPLPSEKPRKDVREFRAKRIYTFQMICGI